MIKQAKRKKIVTTATATASASASANQQNPKEEDEEDVKKAVAPTYGYPRHIIILYGTQLQTICIRSL